VRPFWWKTVAAVIRIGVDEQGKHQGDGAVGDGPAKG